jgi:integrase/recombinase XerD
MQKLKHLPDEDWPVADLEAFERAYAPGDVFDETRGPGAHYSDGWRRMIRTSYRRWLGFFAEHEPAALLEPPAARITPERMRDFIEQLSAEVRPTTVAMTIANLYAAARLIAPEVDWCWLASLKTRLAARAKPMNRFNRLVPGWETLDLGIELMDDAIAASDKRQKQRDLQYRDGLLLALISLWLIRRRSLTALTAGRHVEPSPEGLNILLYPEDTKGKRAESFQVPEELLPYLRCYLQEIRPRLMGGKEHDGLWVSFRGGPLCDGRIYSIARERVLARFGKAMGLHDFRRAAATFVAMDAPELIGLVPGILQHASSEVSERHYNLARSLEASRRVAAHVARTRAKLRPIRLRNEA